MDTTTPKRRNWFRRHIFLLIAAILLVGLGLLFTAGGQRYLSIKSFVTAQPKDHASTNVPANSSGTGSSSANSGAKSDTSMAPASPPASTVNTKMTLSGSHATVQPGGGAQVTGQITNNLSNTKSANIQATFYDKSGGVVGTARGSVTNIDPDRTKPFTLTTTQNVTSYEKMVVETSSLY